MRIFINKLKNQIKNNLKNSLTAKWVFVYRPRQPK